MRLNAALAVAALAPVALGIFADEAFKVDFHHALVGAPEPASTFFHPPYPGTKGALIYTLSQQGVLGAVNPKDGSLVWRQILSGSGGVLRAADTQDVLVTGINSTVASWSSGNGKQGWQTTFAGKEVKDIRLQEDGTTLVLLRDETDTAIVKLDTTTGKQQWLHQQEARYVSFSLLSSLFSLLSSRLKLLGDESRRSSARLTRRRKGERDQQTDRQSSTELPLQLAVAPGSAHLVSFHVSIMTANKIKVTPIDLATGKLGESVKLNADITKLSDVFVSSSVVCWFEEKAFKVNLVGKKDALSFPVESDVTGVEAVFSKTLPHFLVSYSTATEHWADVYHFDPAGDSSKSAARKAYSLPKAQGKGAFSTSTIDDKSYFIRVTRDSTSMLSSDASDTLVQFAIQSFGVDGISPLETLEPEQAVSDVVSKGGNQFALRSAVLLSSGDWVLIRNGNKAWTRHESLSTAKEAVFVTLNKPDSIPVQDLQLEEKADPVSAFVHRITRHVQDWRSFFEAAQDLPDVLKMWLENFVTPGAGADAKHAAFGFKKLVLVRTGNQRLVGLQHGDQGGVLFNVRDEAPDKPLSLVVVSSVEGDTAPWRDLLPPQSQLQLDQGVGSGSATVLYSLREGTLLGHERSGGNLRELWTFTPAPGHEIAHVESRLDHEPVASIGKVLGDRRVLYKYLNPNLVLVTTQDASQGLVSFHLIDAVTGQVLHAAHHSQIDTTRPITSAVSENWFVYSFTSLSSSPIEDYPNGPQIVVAELYESAQANDRGSETNLPHVVSSAFVIPAEISAMTVTQTGQGITSRQLLASLASLNDLVAIPRQALDPRRPVGKEPTAAQQMEEGLVRYAPAIDFDPRSSLSHLREVAGVKKIITTPSAMESTSLVFAYGLDVFGSRVAPSFAFDILNASFNKVSLSLTVIALVAGTMGVAPLVKRRQVDQLWTTPT